MDKSLDDFTNADWNGAILPRLTGFTKSLVKRYTWSTPACLPKGLTVEDIVIGAIQKTLEGLKGSNPGKGVRSWNPSTCPNLLDFLMGVVKSDISALAKSHDHQETDREEVDFTIDEMNLSGSQEVPFSDNSPSRYEELIGKLRPKVETDKEVQQLILAYEELINTDEVASSKAVIELTGFTYPQFRNAKRRLETAIDSIKPEEKGGRRK